MKNPVIASISAVVKVLNILVVKTAVAVVAIVVRRWTVTGKLA